MLPRTSERNAIKVTDNPELATRRTGVFIGDAAIVLHCIEAWIGRGHRCLGLVTAHSRCAEWAAWNGIATHFAAPSIPLTPADLLHLTRGEAPDMLWSIHNIRVLSPAVLALAREAAINYHDALLPAYAGLHAPSWALFAREPRHGITWHRMVAALDAGELLEQEAFTIAANDTAWTLGLRCVEAAEHAYARLLSRLESESLSGRPQPTHGRSYFSASQKPTPGCIINWQHPAEEIYALVRALDFGPADNPLGLPKVLTASGTLAVNGLSISDRPSTCIPGTVVSEPKEDVNYWSIATTTCDVEIHSWTRLDGTAADAADCTARGLRVGEILRSTVPDAEAFSAYERRARRSEAAWRRRLEDLRPFAPSGFETPCSIGSACVVRQLPLNIQSSAAPDEALLRVLTALARDIGEPLDVAFGETSADALAGGAAFCYELAPPLRIDPKPDNLSRHLAAHRALFALPADLTGRSYRLRERAAKLRCPIEVKVSRNMIRERSCLPTLPVSRKLLVEVHDDRADFTTAAEYAAALDTLLIRLQALLDAKPPVCLPGADPSTVIAGFLAQATAQPATVAVVENGRDITYGQLNRRVMVIAESLRRRDIGPGDVVAVRVTGLFDLVTALLGIGVAGAAFWVIDEHETEVRLLRLFHEAAPCALITDDRTWFPNVWASLSRGRIPIVVADGHPALSSVPSERLCPDPDTLAYLAFTSGSTGFSKAVAIEHRSLAGYIQWFVTHSALARGDRVLQVGSPAFDLAYEQIFAALTCGATLVAALRPLGSAREIWRHVRDQAITVLDLPTGLWHQLATLLAQAPDLWPTQVRMLYLGGEAARSDTLAILRQVAPKAFRFVNTYGPTETTIVATALEIPLDFPAKQSDVLPIGIPVAGAIAEICAEDGTLLADGEIGELWLGGPGLARGYRGHPGMTARAFVATSRGRRYRTGDRVSRDHEGMLHFHGRLDRQVKIAGRRIALEEIETALCAINGVRDAAVRITATEPLLAWLELAPGVPLETVVADATQRLPPAMRPKQYEIVASLPRTTSGKMDRIALTVEHTSRPIAAPPADERTDPAMARLFVCWRRALGFTPATPDDNFFDVGGDSLAAITLLATLETEFGVALPVADLLLAPTPRGLVQRLNERRIIAKAAEVSCQTSPCGATCVLEMRPGNGTPLVLIHGLGGHVLRLRSLAQALPEGVACWGIQAPGLDDASETPKTVEALAEHYLAAITPRLNGRPLNVCGMSFGGVVALEMARRHVERGGCIGLVGLFDTAINNIHSGHKVMKGTRVRRWVKQLRRSLRDHLRSTFPRTNRLLRCLRKRNVPEKPYAPSHNTRLESILRNAMLGYRLQATSAPLTFFAATPRPDAWYEALRSQLGADIEVVPVPGAHLSLLEPPHVETLVREILKRGRDVHAG